MDNPNSRIIWSPAVVSLSSLQCWSAHLIQNSVVWKNFFSWYILLFRINRDPPVSFFGETLMVSWLALHINWLCVFDEELIYCLVVCGCKIVEIYIFCENAFVLEARLALPAWQCVFCSMKKNQALEGKSKQEKQNLMCTPQTFVVIKVTKSHPAKGVGKKALSIHWWKGSKGVERFLTKPSKHCLPRRSGADRGFWWGGPAFWPQGGPWAQTLRKIGVFP